MTDFKFDFEKYQPTDKNISVWRYIDLTRLISLLKTNALYFAPLSAFNDPYEGSIPRHMLKRLPEERQQEFQGMHSTYLHHIQKYAACCWHANTGESEALWRLYSGGGLRVALKSTFSKVRTQLPEKVVGVQVRYLDYDAEDITSYSTNGGTKSSKTHFYELVSTKRKAFEHEREVRFFIPSDDTTFASHQIAPGARMVSQDGAKVLVGPPERSIERVLSKALWPSKPNQGVYMDVDLATMIDNIYVAPTADEWEVQAVENLVERYGFKIPVEKSKLLMHPATN